MIEAGKLDRHQLLLTLVVVAGAKFPEAKTPEDISDEAYLIAQHEAIKFLAEEKKKLLNKLVEVDDLNQQFYSACLRASIRVDRDEHSRIRLVRLPVAG